MSNVEGLGMKHLLLSYDKPKNTILHAAIELKANAIIQKVLENVQRYSKAFVLYFFTKNDYWHECGTNGDKDIVRDLLNCALQVKKEFHDEELLIRIVLTCKSAIEIAHNMEKDDIVQEFLTFSEENLPKDITTFLEEHFNKVKVRFRDRIMQ